MYTQKHSWILASSSPRRREILSNSLFTFDISPSDIDESVRTSEPPEDYVLRMAEEKVLESAKKYPNTNDKQLYIGADTIVHFENLILGKPKTEEEAFEFLSLLAGNEHVVTTAVSIVIPNNEQISFAENTKVLFRNVNVEIIRKYIKTKDPFDKAGGYSAQGLGAFLVKSIQGSFHNVIGFPIEKFISLLLEKRWIY